MFRNISVIGLGKLGYPMAQFLSSSGAKISCYDKDFKLVEKLKNDHGAHLHETGLNNLVNNNNELIYHNNISDCIANAEIIYITVPTPSKLDGSFSNEVIIKILDEISDVINKTKKSYIININSTVQPGTIEGEIIPFLEKKGLKNNENFYILYNPYFVALGSVIRNLEEPDYLLIGSSSIFAAKKITKFYNTLYKNPKIRLLKFKEAELTKLLVNTYLTTKISYSNFVKNLCKNFDDVSDLRVLESVGLDARIGTKFMLPGGPYSGPCLPRDNLSLKKFCLDHNIQNSLSDEVQKINSDTIENLYKIISHLKSKHNISSFGFLGLGYKSNTQCFEESYSVKMMKFLESLNIKVFYFDPYLSENFSAQKVETFEELSDKSDIIFLSYVDQRFNPIIQVKQKKRIWDLWYHFSESKFNKIFHKESDFKKFTPIDTDINGKIIKLVKNFG
tara:strand:- start:5700 stop:7043 length:1344 start_codon:yes stop_codon:yes gene_type:complete